MSRYRPARARKRKPPPALLLERTANYQALDRPLVRSRTPIQWPPQVRR